MASLCYMAGRIDPAIRYTEAAQTAISGGSDDHVPYGAEGFLGGAYLAVGQPERWIQWCRAQLARGLDAHAYVTANLVIGLAVAGSVDDAIGGRERSDRRRRSDRQPVCALLGASRLRHGRP